MGKFKESYSPLYYASKEEFFTDIESGNDQPQYVGLLEIVRVLKLISRGRKQAKQETRQPQPESDGQLCFGA